MKVIKVILCIIDAILLIVGIPIIINECYNATCKKEAILGYQTKYR